MMILLYVFIGMIDNVYLGAKPKEFLERLITNYNLAPVK
jgi:hypothetical protein